MNSPTGRTIPSSLQMPASLLPRKRSCIDHDAWELLYVIHGRGNRTAGDTVQPFTAGDIVLIPPSMTHQWSFAPDSADENGRIHYLMAAFSHTFVEQCRELFPELRNRLIDVSFPVNALLFGVKSASVLGNRLMRMRGKDELKRLCEMLLLLPDMFTTSDHALAGRPARIERDVQRMQQICTYVMRHYSHAVTLNGHCRRSRYEPLRILHMVQTLQRHDIFTIPYAVSP